MKENSEQRHCPVCNSFEPSLLKRTLATLRWVRCPNCGEKFRVAWKAKHYLAGVLIALLWLLFQPFGGFIPFDYQAVFVVLAAFAAQVYLSFSVGFRAKR